MCGRSNPTVNATKQFITIFQKEVFKTKPESAIVYCKSATRRPNIIIRNLHIHQIQKKID